MVEEYYINARKPYMNIDEKNQLLIEFTDKDNLYTFTFSEENTDRIRNFLMDINENISS